MDTATLSALPRLAPDVIHPRDVGHGDLSAVVGSGEYAWHFLAEGDSWFTIGALPSSNLLFEMRLARWAQIFNLAYPGDTIKRISTLAKNDDLQRWLARRNFATRFDALILSGGGNDVIDEAAGLISTQAEHGLDPEAPESYVDEGALDDLLGRIQRGFAEIIKIRDSEHSLSRHAPAFVHTYDYATPRNAPARFIGGIPMSGPWLHAVFRNSGMPIELQQRIANHLMDRLAQALWELDSERGLPTLRLPAFHVVETRNTLVMANPSEIGNSNDWLNEIHPNLAGYRKLAARISAKVNAMLG